ncbi:hypothetical protein ZWY2020_053434 [Hordeum vulgare]|nr:hypothetical protein ZWY2020_053434 [Hordeum vulgare]
MTRSTRDSSGWGVCGCRGRIVCAPNSLPRLPVSRLASPLPWPHLTLSPPSCGQQRLSTTTTTTTHPLLRPRARHSPLQNPDSGCLSPADPHPRQPMNILNQPIGPAGAHAAAAAAFPAGAAKDGMPASLRFDAGPRWQAPTTLRRASSSRSYVGAGHADEAAAVKSAEQHKALVPPFQPVTLNFLRSLLDRDSMTSIAEEGGEGAGAAPPLHALRVVVSSAVALDARQTELIARKMRRITGFVNLAIENVVEPSLIAGFVVCYGLDDSHTIDLSVRGRLAALKSRVDNSDLDDRLHPRTPAPLH